MSNEIAEQTTTNSNPRLILELDKTTNEALIEVSPQLVEQLKPHQCDGIQFLWNNVFESIDAIQNKKRSGNGCILAHCMGLGKTLQVISFIHTIFKYKEITNMKTCLVLCPINAGKTNSKKKTIKTVYYFVFLSS
jgi:transcriptional regulator ATRX